MLRVRLCNSYTMVVRDFADIYTLTPQAAHGISDINHSAHSLYWFYTTADRVWFQQHGQIAKKLLCMQNFRLWGLAFKVTVTHILKLTESVYCSGSRNIFPRLLFWQSTRFLSIKEQFALESQDCSVCGSILKNFSMYYKFFKTDDLVLQEQATNSCPRSCTLGTGDQQYPESCTLGQVQVIHTRSQDQSQGQGWVQL